MSIRYARTQAEKLIAEVIPEVAAPIPLKIITKHLDVTVLEEELGDGVSGLLIQQKGMKPAICLPCKDPLHRKRFTTAHELGHLVLRHQFLDGGKVHIDRGYFISQRAPEDANQQEIDANQFAMSLLMPAKILTELVEKTGNKWVTDENVTKFARDFQVSEQVMTIRLEVLGLL